MTDRIGRTRLITLGLAMLCLSGCWIIVGGKDEIHTKEANLKSNLFSMRQAIDQYTLDKNRAPHDLQDLVRAGYLHAIPKDPFTGSADTWQVVQEDVLQSINRTESGVTDVHSRSNRISTEGTPYSTW